MKDYKFLGTINGIYYFPADADFNIWTTLAVFINTGQKSLIINEHSLHLEDGQEEVKDNELVLDDIGTLELELIHANFNNQTIKELIFNKYLDHQNRCQRYDKVF